MLPFVLTVVLCGAPAPIVNAGPGKGWLVTPEVLDSAEVLAVSIKGGWAAIKVVSHRVSAGMPDDYESIDCGYPGMKQYPFSGVRLLTWSLKDQAVDKVFAVYDTSPDLAHCSPAQTSAQVLAAARVEFAARGLDLAKKPVSNFGDIRKKSGGNTQHGDLAMGDRVFQRYEEGTMRSLEQTLSFSPVLTLPQ